MVSILGNSILVNPTMAAAAAAFMTSVENNSTDGNTIDLTKIFYLLKGAVKYFAKGMKFLHECEKIICSVKEMHLLITNCLLKIR